VSIYKLARGCSALVLFAAVLAVTAVPAFAAAPEAPVTEAATSVTGTTATLHGELNPGVSAEAGFHFDYNRNGECAEGTATPDGAPVTGKGVKVSEALTGLEANSEYNFCIVATHLEGEVTESTPGPALSFKTLAAAPVLASESSSALTPFAATLEAQVNPENETTTSCVFEYGETNAYGSSAECAPASLEGPESQLTTGSATGLTPATTYHFRVVVANATGETEGTDGEFTTLPLESPLVTGESAAALTSTAATLHAQVNPNYQETTYSFEYATNEALTGATAIEGEGPLPAEFAELPVNAPLTALLPGTTYYFRVIAKNATGTTEGPVEHFITTDTPSTVTGEAQNITQTSATLAGTVDTSGAASTYRFAYADQADYEAAIAASANPYGQSTPVGTLPGDHEPHTVGPVLVGELKPGTTYHYALIANNSVGATSGSDATFTTAPATPPLAVTGAAQGITPNDATITASVDTRGLPTVTQFEFGTTPYAGSLVASTAETGSATSLTVSASFGGYLQAGTTYYYRVRASNRDGIAFGAEGSFTTGSVPGLPAVTSVQLISWPPFVTAALAEAAQPSAVVTPGSPKPLTKAQKLAKALKACGRKPKSKRAGCRRQAKRRYR